MTTLAIIGGGIAGRSLIYALAKKKKSYSKIIVFESESFAPKCSLRSTAIAAGRGVSTGHSDLGDLLVEGFQTFSRHVEEDCPLGIFPIIQYSGATTKLEKFKQRFDKGDHRRAFGPLNLKHEIYLCEEQAFMIDTKLYLEWLQQESDDLPVEWREEFVLSHVVNTNSVELTTNLGRSYLCDQVVFCGGSYNRFWGQPKAGKPIPGSYYEFHQVDLGATSFSLTLDGDNMIYHAHTHKLLMGSTTEDVTHTLPNKVELLQIYQRLQDHISENLPLLGSAYIISGLREKASKRKPYFVSEGPIHWFGGLYKNAFNLSLHLANEIVSKLP